VVEGVLRLRGGGKRKNRGSRGVSQEGEVVEEEWEGGVRGGRETAVG